MKNYIILAKIVLIFILSIETSARPPSDSVIGKELSQISLNSIALDDDKVKKLLPSQYALEEIGVTFLDALIKKGQMEMAKNAFQTQLDVLKKVKPEQVGIF
uniref:TPR_REGION domain-containing protein n=1 Tax=Strongyloides venezuelensis TaxID=75913 RepID=A0A0K0F8C8_STRVS